MNLMAFASLDIKFVINIPIVVTDLMKRIATMKMITLNMVNFNKNAIFKELTFTSHSLH